MHVCQGDLPRIRCLFQVPRCVCMLKLTQGQLEVVPKYCVGKVWKCLKLVDDHSLMFCKSQT